jgi:hypothetical protein
MLAGGLLYAQFFTHLFGTWFVLYSKTTYMKTKLFIVVIGTLFMQLTTAAAQISTSISGGPNGATFSISVGTNTYQQPNLNPNNQCYQTNNFNSCCTSNHQHNCNANANCCGQKHGCKKHKHKKHDHDCDHDDDWKKSKCHKDHDD